MKRVWRNFVLIAAASLVALLAPTMVVAQSGRTLAGTVVEIQKYGNLVMDLKPKALYDAGFALGDVLSVAVGGTTIEAPFCTSYSDVDTGSSLVRDDQADSLLIVAVNMGNFSTKYGVKVGDQLSFSLAQKAGYLSEYLMRQLKRTNVRSDYATDSIFANFRSLATTGLEPGIVYRSSNPVNNEIGRAAYADALAQAVGIKTVLNLSDSDQEIRSFFAAPGFASDYYKSLYEKGDVKALDMGVDLSSADFSAKLAEGLRFMISHNGPYLLHCTEGKDRAGFVSAVLESLMGAGMQQIVADYMVSYENYYGVKKDTTQYNAIADSNIVAEMTTVVYKLPKGSDLSGVNLAAATERYLLGIGLKPSEIAALKARLSAGPILMSPHASGAVTQIEKYGHAVTDITIKDFNQLGFKMGDMVTVVFGNGFVLDAPYLDGYLVNNGYPLVRAYPGQTNIAVCINYGKLNQIAQVGVGSRVTLMLSGPGAYLTQYEIRKLVRTNNRADYSSDAVFANFRNIVVGRIAKGELYRSSSPIDNQLGRASYADRLMQQAGVKSVVNLSDSADAMKGFLAAKDFASPYYAQLYRDNQIIFLNMNLAFASADFRASVAKGLEFMASHPGPYLFHCTEGKDRTGFVAALLESLMGATKDQIVTDYMQSYVDFYGVKTGTEQYNLISQDVLGMLKVISGTSNLETANLAYGARNYLLAGGMSRAQIDQLEANLSKPLVSVVPADPIAPLVREVKGRPARLAS